MGRFRVPEELLSGPGGGKMGLQGASGGPFGCFREDFWGLWDPSLWFPVAFLIPDGHFLISMHDILHKSVSRSINLY